MTTETTRPDDAGEGGAGAEPMEGAKSGRRKPPPQPVETTKMQAWGMDNLRRLLRRLHEVGYKGIPADIRRPTNCPVCRAVLGEAEVGGLPMLVCPTPDCYVHQIDQFIDRPTQGWLLCLGVTALETLIRQQSHPDEGKIMLIDGVPFTLETIPGETVRAGILRALGVAQGLGMTTNEIRRFLGRGASMPNTRVTELVTLGKVIDSRRKRENDATVWVLSGLGVAPADGATGG